jgi:hypothetical protein
MLGDLFGTKGNYELGLLYSSRRKFLAPAGKSSLEPPDEFITKRQAHRQHLQKVENKVVPAPKGIFGNMSLHNKENPKTSSISSYPSQHSSNQSATSKHIDDKADSKNGESTTKFKKVAHMVMDAALLDHHMDDAAKAMWSEEIVAGVRVWTNKTTGEVLSDPPWLAKKTLVQRSPSRKRVFRVIVPEDRAEPKRESEFGTGSLVYDHQELEDLFGMLDKIKR